MKKLLLALFVFALVWGIALATEVIGSASSIPGAVWVQHRNTVSKVRLTEGMQLLDDDKIFFSKEQLAQGKQHIRRADGNHQLWRHRIPGCGQGNEKSTGARLVLLPCRF